MDNANWTDVVVSRKLEYKLNEVAVWFHNLPHFNFTFQKTSPYFNVTDVSYLQSLATWAVIPLLCLVLTWVMFMFYFCSRCCDQPSKKKRNISPFKFLLVLGGLMLGTAIGVGLYGNDVADRGMDTVLTSVKSVNGNVMDVQRVLKSIGYGTRNVEKSFNDLDELISTAHIANMTVKELLEKYIRTMMANVTMVDKSLREIRKDADKIQLRDLLEDVNSAEYIRWAVTICVECWQLLLCLTLLFAVTKSSKAWMIWFATFGVVTGLLTTWTVSSAYLAASVGTGDLCMGPDEFILSQSQGLHQDVVNYYIDCSKSSDNPFVANIAESQKVLSHVNQTVNIISKIAAPLIPFAKLGPVIGNITKQLNDTAKSVNQLNVLVDCVAVHKQYTQALGGLCEDCAYGFALILVAALSGAVVLMFAIFVVSCTWRNIRVRRYYVVDEDDPFLPRSMTTTETSPMASTSGPMYGTITNGTSSREVAQDRIPLMRGHDPPPKYEYTSTNRHSPVYPSLSDHGDSGQASAPPYS